jgi:capsule polysaccharide export protein KpsE/RkpR
MSALPFNTHAFVKRLQSAGFTEEQAEVIADIQLEAGAAYIEQAKHDFHLDDVATKRDLREVELKIEARIAETKADLTRWIVGAGLLQTSLIIGVLMKVAKLI